MSVYPDSVTQLRLLSSFAGFAVRLADCLIILSDEEFYAFDDKVQGYSICSKDIPQELELNQEYFTIKNCTKKNIAFWSIDGKFITKSQMQKCDCAIFDENVFCLVEFKTDSEGKSDETKEEIIKHAQNQIVSMYKLITEKIKTKGIDFSQKVTVEGHICLSKRYPRKSSEEMSLQALFAEKNGFGLYFDGIKEF
ncbi:hypothetical protein [Parabacteroides goldsteinii]|jgi:hypothetical protein|uniref:hypothetical protein n=1 Tax=Parabacteroides goldsteinii TaxID=328812 RepID=UPI003AB512DC